MITNNNKYTDIPFFLTKNEYTNDINLIKGSNTIRASIKNLLNTIPGERPFNNELGSMLSLKPKSVDLNDRLEYNAFVDAMYRSINNNERRIDNLNIRIIDKNIIINFTQKDEELAHNLNIKLG